jgi:tRNA pseudouridine38-40 synthase
MVRNIVGSLVYVGCGRQPVDWVGEVLKKGDRRLAAPTFAASGLYLSHVEYPPHWGVPPAPALEELEVVLSAAQ